MSQYPSDWTFSGTVASITKTFNWLDCQGFSHLRVMAFSNADYVIDIDWSTDAGINSDHQDSSTVQAGGTTWLASYGIKSRWVRLKYSDDTGIGGKVLRIQGSLNSNAPSLSALVNVGAGSELYKVNDHSIRSLLSSDASVSIVQNANDIDLTTVSGSAVTLGSAGGTSLVNDGVGPALLNKGLVAGTAMSFVDSGTTITLNAATVASSVWQETSAQIKPITASTTGLICGNTATNTISGVRSCIVGGQSNSMSVGAGSGFMQDSVIAGCSSCILGPDGAVYNCLIGGSKTSEIQSGFQHAIVGGTTNIIDEVDNSGIVAGTNNTIRGTRCAIVGGTANSMTGSGFMQDSVISGGNTCILGTAGAAYNCFIGGSKTSEIQTGFQHAIIGGTTNIIDEESNSGIVAGTNNTIRGTRCAIIGGNANTMSVGAGASFMRDSAILASDSCTFGPSGAVYKSVIMGSQNASVSVGQNTCIISGSNGSSAHNNCVLMTSGTALASSVNAQYSCKFAGGYRFYSNDLATTGVTLAAGASSWAAVSDINKKENLMPMGSVLDRIAALNLYEYNYKGNPVQQRCCGPTAQDWYSLFPVGMVEIPIKDANGNNVLDGLGQVITEAKPAKDQLSIEVMDMVGCLMRAVQELNQKVKTLQGI